MTESNTSTGLISKAIDLAKHWPSICFAIFVPAAYLFFAPKGHKVFVLKNHDLAELSPELNPWLGLVLLYFLSFTIVGLLNYFISPFHDWWQDYWYKIRLVRHRKINNPYWTDGKSKEKGLLIVTGSLIVTFATGIISISTLNNFLWIPVTGFVASIIAKTLRSWIVSKVSVSNFIRNFLGIVTILAILSMIACIVLLFVWFL